MGSRRRRIGTTAFAVRVIAGVALAAALGGCGAPELVALSSACQADKDGSKVAVQGYVVAGKSISCSSFGGDLRCGLDVAETADGASGATAGLDILVGDGSNEMDKPPSSYSPEDLRIRADDGSQVKVGDQVKASGKISVAPGTCFLTVDTLERAA